MQRIAYIESSKGSKELFNIRWKCMRRYKGGKEELKRTIIIQQRRERQGRTSPLRLGEYIVQEDNTTTRRISPLRLGEYNGLEDNDRTKQQIPRFRGRRRGNQNNKFPASAGGGEATTKNNKFPASAGGGEATKTTNSPHPREEERRQKQPIPRIRGRRRGNKNNKFSASAGGGEANKTTNPTSVEQIPRIRGRRSKQTTNPTSVGRSHGTPRGQNKTTKNVPLRLGKPKKKKHSRPRLAYRETP